MAFFGTSRPVYIHTPVLRYTPGFTTCDPKPIFGTCRLRAYIRYYCLDSLVSPSDLVPCSSTTQPVHLFSPRPTLNGRISPFLPCYHVALSLHSSFIIANATTVSLGSLACLPLLLCLSFLLVLCDCLTAQNSHSTT